jgi:hypothetical protein
MEKHLIVSIIGNVILFIVALFLLSYYYSTNKKGKKNASGKLLVCAFSIIIGILFNLYYLLDKEDKIEF